MKTLKVVKVENGETPEFSHRTDKNGKPYTYVQVSTPSMILGTDELGEKIKMRVEPKVSAFIAYSKSYLKDSEGNELPQYGHDFQRGEVVPGSIETRKVVPYFIESENGLDMKDGKKGRSVDTASVIVFGNSDNADWELKIQQAFKAGGFVLADNSTEALKAHPSSTVTRSIDQQRADQPSTMQAPSQNSTAIQDRSEDLVEHEAGGESVQTTGGNR